MAIKRLNYFTHQLLREQDLKDEQAYHIAMRQLHNRQFHAWGVVEGLEVVERGPKQIEVKPGSAVDKEGREIVLQEREERDLSSFGHDSHGHDSHVYITIGYHQEETDHVSRSGMEGHARVTETAVIHESRQDQLDSAAVVLARVHLDEHGHIRHIDMSPEIRKQARSSTGTGWVRLPFKPVRLPAVRIDRGLVAEPSSEHDFIVDEATAYCYERGARGSMEIPVPPGATHLSGFRVAGVTKGQVTVRLFRVGWNLKEGKGERSQLLEEKIEGGSFHKEVTVQSTLDESHALAASVHAQGETEIWLVAVRFE